MRRIARVALCALLMLGLLLAAPAPAHAETTLHFTDGRFKIMVVADIQDVADVNADTLRLITLALEREAPDLVVLLGDNVFGLVPYMMVSSANVRRSIDAFLAPIVEAGVPFALVLGNHDLDAMMPQDEQMAYYRQFPGCLAEVGMVDGRAGNYNLMVVGEEDGRPKLNLWFLNSGRKVRTREYGLGYAYVTETQIAWYEENAAFAAELNGGEPMPAVLFQHIPVPEMYELLRPVAPGTPGAVEGYGHLAGNWYVADEDAVWQGALNERPCTPDYNSGQFASWQRCGDVMAAVFGHDHTNDLAGTYQGVDLIYTAAAGYYSYGKGDDRGVRIMEFYEQDVRAYTTRMLWYSELTGGELPHGVPGWGTMMRDYGLWLLAGVVVLILLAAVAVPAVLLARAARKKRRARSAATAQNPEE